MCPTSEEQQRVGLCFSCCQARRQLNPRGNVFYRCTLAQTEKRLLPYPPLPVEACSGYTAQQADTQPIETPRRGEPD